MAINYIIRENPLLALIASNEIEVLRGYPTLEASKTELSVTSKYKIPWDKINDARKAFLGYNKSENGAFVQYKPYKLEFVGENVFADKFNSIPMGRMADDCFDITGRYDFAEVTVTFKPFSVGSASLGGGGGSQPNVYDESFDPITTFEVDPGIGIFWDAAQKEAVPSDKVPNKRITRGIWTLDYPDLPGMPDGWDTWAGALNSDAIDRTDEFNIKFAPQTLLISGVRCRVGTSPDGAKLITMSFSAEYNRFTWNKLQRKTGDDPVQVFDNAGVVKKIFPTEINLGNALPGI